MKLDHNIWICWSGLSRSVHKLYRLKALITLEKVNTSWSVVKKKKSLNEHNFDIEALELRHQICYKAFHLKNLFLKWLRILQNKNYKGLSSESGACRKLISEVSIFTLKVEPAIYIAGSKFNNSIFLAFSYISNKRFYKHDYFLTL